VESIRFILENKGYSWENLVDITVFLSNKKRYFKAFNTIHTESFKDFIPCCTTVEVNALPTPMAVELKCPAF